MARQMAQVRTMAASLFSALCRGCTQQCQAEHKVMAQLESRVEEPSAISVAFNLVLPLREAILQQTRVIVPVADRTGLDPYSSG